MAMTLVSTTTVGSGGAVSIEFTNIPQTGKDLLILVSARSTSTNDQIGIHFNGTSGFTNYAGRELKTTGTSVSTTTGNINYVGAINHTSSTANTFASSAWTISNYAVAAAKSVSVESAAESNTDNAFYIFLGMSAISWSVANAVTAVSLTPLSANFAQHSTASLYIIS